MEKNFLLYVIVAALFCGSWPIVAQFSNLDAAWKTLMFAVGTGVVGLLWILQNTVLPPLWALAWGFSAGISNGIGVVVLMTALGAGAEVSSSLAIFFAFLILVGFAGGLLVLHDPLVLRKLLGVALILVGVYFTR